MRVAFDLDDTLLPGATPFACGLAAPGLAALALAAEPLRAGTVELFAELRRLGCEVWVYTTSMRPAWRVRLHFAAHGLLLDGVINDRLHREAERRSGARWPVKYPPAFGIDLLVDDSLSLLEASRRHGFAMVRVAPDDARWRERVLARVSGG